jgi:hypothetical protein
MFPFILRCFIFLLSQFIETQKLFLWVYTNTRKLWHDERFLLLEAAFLKLASKAQLAAWSKTWVDHR